MSKTFTNKEVFGRNAIGTSITEVKLSGNRLMMSDGTIREFASKKKRDNFERVARAYKHGWQGPHEK